MEEILIMNHICKGFSGVQILKDVSFVLHKGEVHSIVGENGAGKSTFIKIIGGVYQYDSGEIIYNGSNVKYDKPSEAIASGICIVHQELNQCNNLTIAENIFIGNLPKSKGNFVDYKVLYENTKKITDMLGLELSPNTKLDTMSVAQRQLVEIGKAIAVNANIIIMDEPTSALSEKEIEILFEIIEKLKNQGIAVIYISHKIEELLRISDTITIMRDGCFVSSGKTTEYTKDSIISHMIGRDILSMYPKKTNETGEIVLEANGITNSKVHNVSFYARKGEIVGFAGLMGAGRSELVKAVYGYDTRESGTVKLEGKEIPPNSTLMSRKGGIGFVPEDRREEGIFPELAVKNNISITLPDMINKGAFIDNNEEKRIVSSLVDRLSIKISGLNQLIKTMSGGNQQKAILARWIAREDIKVLIIDEPTRGIDVGAKTEIYNIFNTLSSLGTTIIMVSSEMPEILGICDRIYVMNNGQITGELNRQDATPEKILQYAIE